MNNNGNENNENMSSSFNFAVALINATLFASAVSFIVLLGGVAGITIGSIFGACGLASTLYQIFTQCCSKKNAPKVQNIVHSSLDNNENNNQIFMINNIEEDKKENDIELKKKENVVLKRKNELNLNDELNLNESSKNNESSSKNLNKINDLNLNNSNIINN